ncbi:MAG TPA: dTMP kinase [Terriglobales bacterium]|nr:dTMP kinase [Terriglobales bacterium]
MVAPRFITFEGLDGSGKSTQIEHLAEALRASGERVLLTRQPGGTDLGEKIRALVLAAPAAPEAELALMVAARAQAVRECILPALEAGNWLLCDRFHDATEAYQGGGRGLDRAAIRELHRLLCADLQPQLTLFLDLDPAASLARARNLPGASHFEREELVFFGRVAAAYREIAAREPARFCIIPAQGSSDAVAALVAAAVANHCSWRAPR